VYYLITYDISDNKTRKKIEKLLSSYGYRVNYSVFEIESTKNSFDSIIKELKEITKDGDRDIRVYVLNKDVIKNSFTLNSRDIFDGKELYF